MIKLRMILVLTVSGLLLAGYSLLFTGCAPQNGDPKPPNIAYGRDMCDSCGMIISEPQFAAAVLTADGKTLKFDDAGEMFAYHSRHPEISVRVWFVHDYASQNWINGQAAFYVMSAEVKSPMGTGTAAFAEKGSAEAFAGRVGAKVMTFEEALRVRPTMGKKGL